MLQEMFRTLTLNQNMNTIPPKKLYECNQTLNSLIDRLELLVSVKGVYFEGIH